MITAPEMLEERVMSGDQLALARLITLIENNDPLGLDTLSSLFPNTGNAHPRGGRRKWRSSSPKNRDCRCRPEQSVHWRGDSRGSHSDARFIG
jgi:hypothetical protein